MRISKVTRRDITDLLREKIWWGRLSEIDFLLRMYDLQSMPSTDSRFSTAAQDIQQHRVSWSDWPNDWVFGDPRFKLLDGDDDVFLQFLCEVVHPIVRSDQAEAAELVRLFNEHLRPDGFELVQRSNISGRPVYSARALIDAGEPTQRLADARDVAAARSADHLARQITRMEAAIESDPALAIGTAKELIESTCRTILADHGFTPESDCELGRLVKFTTQKLALTRDDVDDAGPAAESLRRLLGSLSAVTQSLAELRNLHGTGHGRSGLFRGLETRHAKLAAGAAATLSVFLFETNQIQKPGG